MKGSAQGHVIDAPSSVEAARAGSDERHAAATSTATKSLMSCPINEDSWLLAGQFRAYKPPLASPLKHDSSLQNGVLVRYELADSEWFAIRPMLPNEPRGVPRVNDRRVLNGIFWVLR